MERTRTSCADAEGQRVPTLSSIHIRSASKGFISNNRSARRSLLKSAHAPQVDVAGCCSSNEKRVREARGEISLGLQAISPARARATTLFSRFSGGPHARKFDRRARSDLDFRVASYLPISTHTHTRTHAHTHTHIYIYNPTQALSRLECMSASSATIAQVVAT